MYRDLDYFLTKNGVVGLVKGSHHPLGQVLTLPVYQPDTSGDRWTRRLGRMKKMVVEPYCGGLPEFETSQAAPLAAIVEQKNILKVFRPPSAFQRFLKEEPAGSIWRRLSQALLDVGVPEPKIGIFGSTLVGLDQRDGQRIKDVDFVVYGSHYCQLVRQKIAEIRQAVRAKPISITHIAYQAQKYSAMGVGQAADLLTTLPNKWSSLEFGPGLVSTLRFVAERDGQADLLAQPIVGLAKTTGVVIDDFGANFMPRVFTLRRRSGQIVTVASYFWAHQAAVKRGDMVQVAGNRRADDIITLERSGHRLRVVKDSDERES